MIIDHVLTQNALILETITDRHGDQQVVDSTTENVRFRYITEINKGNMAEGLSTADAIIWFKSNTVAKESSIVYVDNKYWRVDKLVKARRLSNSNVLFNKAYVTAYAFNGGLVS